jgi:hypothetical protein
MWQVFLFNKLKKNAHNSEQIGGFYTDIDFVNFRVNI